MQQGCGKRKTYEKILIGILLLVLYMGITGAAKEGRTVRVAFFPMEGFHEHNLDGSRSGMDVEYLTALTEFTDWEIQYVDCESWDDALRMLREGEADLLGSAQYSGDRAKIYRYADFPSGYTFGAVAVEGSSTLAYEDFRVMGDLTYGVVKTYIRKSDFVKYMKSHGVEDLHLKEYDSTALMQQALKDGEVDAVVHTFMEIQEGQRIVGRFSPAPFYYIAEKSNEELMEELNQAISDLKMSDPVLENVLMNKYYSSRLDQKEVLSTAEKEYVQEKETITVGYPDGYYPFSYEADGAFQGLSREVFDRLKMDTGLQVEYQRVENNEEAFEKLKTGEMDVLAYCTAEEDVLDENQAEPVKSYGSAPLAVFAQESLWPVRVKRLVSVKEVSEASEILEDSEEALVTLYESNRECIDALYREEADAAICNSYLAEAIIGSDYKLKGIEIRRVLKEEQGIAAAVWDDADEELKSILKKSLQEIDERQINAYLLKNPLPTPFVLTDWIHKNSLLFAGIAVLVISLILLVALRMLYTSRKIQRLLYRDPELGVWNLNYFAYWGERLLTGESKTRYAIAYLNVVQFRLYCTLYGWEAGNQFLESMVEVLAGSVEKEKEGYARSQGDRFVLMLSVKSREEFMERIRRLKERLEAELQEAFGIHMAVRVGVCCLEQGKEDMKSAVEKANQALEFFRDGSEEIQVYDEEMDRRIRFEHRQEELLERADVEKDFTVFYQEKVDIRSGKIIGAEALARFLDPSSEGTIRLPGFFIPYYEKTGKVKEVDFFVLDRVCRMMRRRMEEGKQVVPVSCNFSRRHFSDPDFPDRLEAVLDKYGIPREWIEVEITETIIMEEIQQGKMKDTLEEMHKRKIRLSIDDFGVGYSSLGVFEQVPASVIKLDRSFFANHMDRSRQVKILQKIISLADALDTQVVCEGVESAKDVELMKEVGAYVAQGFYYGEPAPEQAFEEKLERERNG